MIALLSHGSHVSQGIPSDQCIAQKSQIYKQSELVLWGFFKPQMSFGAAAALGFAVVHGAGSSTAFLKAVSFASSQ